jgi:hypothetical protein
VEGLQQALEPYRHLDPAGWVGVFRLLPLWGALAAAASGTMMLLIGGRRLFRLVASPLGASIATIWAAPLAARLGFGAWMKPITLVATFSLATAGLIWPPVAVFFAFGIPSGLLGGQLAGGDWLLGFGPAFFVGGAIGVVLHRLVAAVLSAVVGAWVAVLGVLGAVAHGVPSTAWASENPLAIIAVAGVLAVGGAVLQIFVRPSEEQARAEREKRTVEKKKAKEQRGLEERWARYNTKR